MEFGEIIFYVFIGLIVVYVISAFLLKKTPEELAEEKRLRESLADETIYDPETGVKLTLEQAESGHWITNDNPTRIKSEEELDNHYFGNEKIAEKFLNSLKARGFQTEMFNESEIDFLCQTKILSKYDNWSYSNLLSYNEGRDFVFLPAVHYDGNRHQNAYHESQLMFWIFDDKLSGHLFAKEKTAFESFTDAIRNDDPIRLENYETFLFEKLSLSTTIYLTKILQAFDNEKGLEIEMLDNNLFIKTTRYVNEADFLRIEKILGHFY